MPSVQIGRLAVPSTVPPIETSQPNANHAASNPPSSSPSDNLSVISGTTLPHALIGSSFILSSSERCSSRRRCGVVRQDSATLPRCELGFLPGPGKLSSIPPVHPVPATLMPSKPNYPSPVKSGASTESEYPTSGSCTTSPEIVISSIIPQQTSLTQEVPSPTISRSTRESPSIVPDTTSRRKAGPVPARTRFAKNGVLDGLKTAVEVPLPENSQATTQDSLQERSDNHGWDEFNFVPPESFGASASPNSDSSASYVAPPPKRSDANRGPRKRRAGGSSFVRNSCMIDSLSRSAFKSKNCFTVKVNSLADGVSASYQGYSMASATISEHDYGELLNYNMTVSPEPSISLQASSSASAGYQTFPETPVVFSPLWSQEYALLAKSDGQVLRGRPPSPKSAELRLGKLCPRMRAMRQQLDNKDSASGALVLCRSQSSLLPGQQAPSPKQAESKLSPPMQVNDETGVSDETNQSLTANATNSVEVRSAVRPHPLAHISSSSSCFPEEEALQALAPHSALSPSLVIDSVNTLFNLMSVSASVIDSSVKSPTAVPLPGSTDGSPFNSPALPDSVTGASPSTSPLGSTVPTTTAAVSSPLPSNSPFSAPSSSLGGSSFLPSPSPSASLNEPLSQPHSPMPIVSSLAMLDDLVYPSPSSAPPPPYHTVVSERTAHHPDSISTPSLSRTSSTEQWYQRGRQASNSLAASGTVRNRWRTRPPLPIGPRKPSAPGQILCSFVPGVRDRNGSTSSVASSDPIGTPGSLWRTLQSAVSKPPPKFQPPPPKWRGLTLEAAKWTFTSAQLQETVSRAIQQASEGSSLRLLRLEILDGEIADEMHRLELQHTDVKAQYKALVRKRWALMGVLAGHIEGVEMNDATTVSRTVEELAEVLLALDHLADKMHNIVLQMAQLKSLRDVHNASALAMAVRKINGLFVRQMAEKERLHDQVDTLQTERNEAWKHAEDVAQDYDTLNDRMSVTAFASGDVRVHGETQSSAGSKRSTRISAVRKSSARLSQAGLRSRGKHRSVRSSSSTTRSTSLAPEDIPPVPRLWVKPLSVRSTALPAPIGKALFIFTPK